MNADPSLQEFLKALEIAHSEEVQIPPDSTMLPSDKIIRLTQPRGKTTSISSEKGKKELDLTRFALLPTELKIMIFGYACPPGQRMLPLQIHARISDDLAPHYTFSKARKFGACNVEPEWQPSWDLGLLSVGRESRDEYLRQNPNTLPAVKGGKIFYNVKYNVVFIENWDVRSLKARALSNAIERRLPLQSWFTDIKHLAVHYFSLDWSLFTPLRLGGGIQSVKVFEKLEGWFVLAFHDRDVQFPGSYSADQLRFRTLFRLARDALIQYKARNPSYSMPNLRCLLLESTRHKEVKCWWS